MCGSGYLTILALTGLAHMHTAMNTPSALIVVPDRRNIRRPQAGPACGSAGRAFEPR